MTAFHLWICALLLAATAVDVYYGLIFLLAGFCWSNRLFAYLHLQVGPIPLYVTELFLGMALLRIVLDKRVIHSATAKTMPRWPWLGFIVIAAISTCRGLMHYPAAGMFYAMRRSLITRFSHGWCSIFH